METRGFVWDVPWKRSFGILPRQMARTLTNAGRPARVEKILQADRSSWLKNNIMFSKATALFVRAWENIPISLHWVVACGMNGRDEFFVYDPRIGDSCIDSDLPIGNVVWSERHLLKVWQPPLIVGRKSVAVL